MLGAVRKIPLLAVHMGLCSPYQQVCFLCCHANLSSSQYHLPLKRLTTSPSAGQFNSIRLSTDLKSSMMAFRTGKIWPLIPRGSHPPPFFANSISPTIRYGSGKPVFNAGYQTLTSGKAQLGDSLAFVHHRVVNGLPSIRKWISQNHQVSSIHSTSLRSLYN